MSKRHDLLKKILMIMTVLFMVIALLPVSAGQILFAEDGEEEEEDGAPEIYTYLTNMADNPPSDWNQTKDPYGYGLNNTFFLNSQQELLAYRYYGHNDQKIYSYDTLAAKNEGYALDGVKSTKEYSIPKAYTLSHARTVGPKGPHCRHRYLFGRLQERRNNSPYLRLCHGQGRTSKQYCRYG